ncbi:MAG: glycoside hydrolase family 97 protein [Ignavibacteriales bacterium]|nr:glycoside hydrolase family 97 protein [Ignavibacteriales bacterium]
MTKQIFILTLILFISGICQNLTVHSPGKIYTVTFELNSSGTPVYSVKYKDKPVVQLSTLGIILKDLPDFAQGLTLVRIDTSSFDEIWEPVWGEQKQIRNQYDELAATLTKKDYLQNERTIIIRFRAADDGVGFRYEFPKQNHLSYFVVLNELTKFQLTGNHKAFWIPGDFDSQEYKYNTGLLSGVHAFAGMDEGAIGTKSIIADSAVQSPLLMKTSGGLYVSIFEAALLNYPAMHLLVNRSNFELTSYLPSNPLGSKSYMQTPCQTPWRTIIAADNAPDILNSKLVLNLNEPCKLKDVSWIKPQKYVGIWWELHVGKSSWNYADSSNIKLQDMDWHAVKPNGHHGATTERTKVYIDFAAQHGFAGVLVEGWNVGWEDWYGNMKEEVFDFVTPYPDFNVTELQDYAVKKGVKLIMHHETSASAANYERRLTDAFAFMKKHNYDAVKTGYVGRIIPRGESHDGQWMVDHYIRVIEKAAANKIMVDAHEPVRPTGLHRTYPNFLACEAARGNEFNGWSDGNPPEHETILPFTRLLGGPMDYTPGIFQIDLSYYKKDKKEKIHTTLVKQLALYVTMYSPLQMAADLPENYNRFLDAFQFIKNVAVDWDDTKILEAEPGDYLTIARKAKHTEKWFIGAITDENPRNANIDLSFLTPGKKYTAFIYQDGKDAHYETNPMSYTITKDKNVDSKTLLTIQLAAGGGAAIEIVPLGE